MWFQLVKLSLALVMLALVAPGFCESPVPVVIQVANKAPVQTGKTFTTNKKLTAAELKAMEDEEGEWSYEVISVPAVKTSNVAVPKGGAAGVGSDVGNKGGAGGSGGGGAQVKPAVLIGMTKDLPGPKVPVQGAANVVGGAGRVTPIVVSTGANGAANAVGGVPKVVPVVVGTGANGAANAVGGAPKVVPVVAGTGANGAANAVGGAPKEAPKIVPIDYAAMARKVVQKQQDEMRKFLRGGANIYG